MAILLLQCSLLAPAGDGVVASASAGMPAPSTHGTAPPSGRASTGFGDNLTVESATYPGELDAYNYSDVLLLINSNSQMSKDVGEYFAAARGIASEHIAYLDVPLLVMAGTADTIVPYAQSVRLFEAAPGPKRLVTCEGADHNDPALTFGARLLDETTRFLGDVLGTGPDPA